MRWRPPLASAAPSDEIGLEIVNGGSCERSFEGRPNDGGGRRRREQPPRKRERERQRGVCFKIISNQVGLELALRAGADRTVCGALGAYVILLIVLMRGPISRTKVISNKLATDRCGRAEVAAERRDGSRQRCCNRMRPIRRQGNQVVEIDSRLSCHQHQRQLAQ